MRYWICLFTFFLGHFSKVSHTGTLPVTSDERVEITGTSKEEWTPIHLWPGGLIPYLIPDGSYDDQQKGLVLSAMKRWEAKTCVKFVPWTEDLHQELEVSYVKFFSAGSCFSDTGKEKKQPQLVGIGKACLQLPTVVHELGHTIGLVHEMERKDRDYFITVYYDNMNPDSSRNYQTTDAKKILYPLYGVPYDYKSIMHYGPKAWSSNGNAVTVTLDPAYQSVIGRASDVSFFDALYVNTAYNCSAKCSGSMAGLCRNGGFLGGPDCRCVCQDGYSGQFCDQPLPGFERTVHWKCQKGWVFQAGYCYLFETEARYGKTRAQASCFIQNATLATFKTRPELEWMSRQTEESIVMSRAKSFWVGMSRKAGQTDIVWEGGAFVDTNLISLADESDAAQDACAIFDGETVTLTGCGQLPETGYVCRKEFDPRCGGRYVLGDTQEVIQSPGFPTSYPSDVECEYVIQTKPDNKIQLTFDMFMLNSNCKGDYVEINMSGDVTQDGKRYCGTDLRGKSVTSETNLAILIFKTNSRLTSIGFKAKVEKITPLGVSTQGPFTFFDMLRSVFYRADDTSRNDGLKPFSLNAFVDAIKSMVFSKVL